MVDDGSSSVLDTDESVGRDMHHLQLGWSDLGSGCFDWTSGCC